MAHRFSSLSLSRLHTCHPDLQEVLNEAIKYIDFSVIEGHRNKERQDVAFAEGKSKLKWPHSMHNTLPSMAVDIAPYPIDWNDRERFYWLAGHIMAIAASKGIHLRYGGDWDGDGDIKDNRFQDLVHFELDKNYYA